ncbi:MAG: cytidine deaminase [Fimbriimonadaceae bacterium]|nr:cytidine deaminase [Fimbriimonadaceae bacterium]
MINRDDLELIAVARESRGHAYAPYSGYRVGAAVRGRDGRIWAGCNIENVSFGLTICAERVALGKMVSEGCRDMDRVALYTMDGSVPCGSCLQAMREFAGDPDRVLVFLAGETGPPRVLSLAELLPYGFDSEVVKAVSVK